MHVTCEQHLVTVHPLTRLAIIERREFGPVDHYAAALRSARAQVVEHYRRALLDIPDDPPGSGY